MSEANDGGGSSAKAKAEGAQPRKPKIGDTRPAPKAATKPNPRGNQAKQNQQKGGQAGTQSGPDGGNKSGDRARRRRRRGNTRKRGTGQGNRQGPASQSESNKNQQPVSQILVDDEVELDEKNLKRRRGRSRKGRPVGRYLMVVAKRDNATHIAVLEGRTLIEYYVSRPSDDIFQIHGNIYLGKVQNVLPGMEAAFIDIGTPKNAVIYRSDVEYDKDEFEGRAEQPKIEQILRPRQNIVCQVTKNPIAHKGARLSSQVSLPGRFVVLVPNSSTYGISKRLPDDERRRLRQILDRIRPENHGLIVRTAAENVTAGEIERDVAGLVAQWKQIEKLAKQARAPSLLYQEPDMAVRVIREEFNKEYRGVVIDDRELYEEMSEYISHITPALADRVEHYNRDTEPISLFERYHVHEQLHKALDRKVWLPSGGSLIIESTEALTVIDVNTGKNVGSSSLEETVFQNNLEAAEGIAHQLRLRDIGGIIVIDFVDMESKKNRDQVMRAFRSALARDKTRTQVFDISELGLAEMTRKRIGEGLLESLSDGCPHCEGRGFEVKADILSEVE